MAWAIFIILSARQPLPGPQTVCFTVFLSDINNFAPANQIYAQYFKEPFPARSAFQVAALPLGADLEVEAVFRL
jgi:2-iminobutanoate/2-iminopropanoate deaminase